MSDAAKKLRRTAELMRHVETDGVDVVFMLAVAAWLDDTARVWEAVDADPDFVQDEPALAVANAYLGGTP